MDISYSVIGTIASVSYQLNQWEISTLKEIHDRGFIYLSDEKEYNSSYMRKMDCDELIEHGFLEKSIIFSSFEPSYELTEFGRLIVL
jgi:hypothetical protein